MNNNNKRQQKDAGELNSRIDLFILFSTENAMGDQNQFVERDTGVMAIGALK